MFSNIPGSAQISNFIRAPIFFIFYVDVIDSIRVASKIKILICILWSAQIVIWSGRREEPPRPASYQPGLTHGISGLRLIDLKLVSM